MADGINDNADDALTREYIYSIKLTNLQSVNDEIVENIIKSALNVPPRGTEGNNEIEPPFYKAKVHRIIQEGEFAIIVHFYLLSRHHITNQREAVNAFLKEQIPNGLIEEGVPFGTLVEVKREMKRNPNAAADALFPHDNPGFCNIPGDNLWQKFLNYWLIVPRVQWDFFDLLYQMYTFDIFHQGFKSKFVHFFTIPANAMLSMMFLAQFKIGDLRYGCAISVNGALIMLGILAVAYVVMGCLRKSVLWGIGTFVVLILLNIFGNVWYDCYKVDGHPWYNPTTWNTNPIIWSYVMSLIQAASHMTEPQVPPYITGLRHWESISLFCCGAKTRYKWLFLVASIPSFLILSVAVAWFSWIHLIGTEVIYIMAGIGYRPSFFNKFHVIVEKLELQGNPILDHFPTSWQDLYHNIPAYVITELKQHELIEESGDLEMEKKQAYTALANIHLSSLYLRRGIKPQIGMPTVDKHLSIMANARKGNFAKLPTVKTA